MLYGTLLTGTWLKAATKNELIFEIYSNDIISNKHNVMNGERGTRERPSFSRYTPLWPPDRMPGRKFYFADRLFLLIFA